MLAVLLITMSFIMYSCGKKQTSITVDKVKINGNSNEYIGVVAGTYDIKLVDDKINMSVKFKTLKTFDVNKIGEYTSIGNMALQILDASGSPISMASSGFSPASVGDWNKVKSLLTSKQDEEVMINFEYGGFMTSKDQLKDVLENGKGFEIVSADIQSIKEDEPSSSSASESSSSSGCDQFIKDYEEFVDEYITVLKKYKANPTDASIFTEYSEMLAKAGEMESSGKDCKDVKYSAKLGKLMSKLAGAVSGI